MPAGQQQPEGERVQAREGHVARADHQRQEVVGEARHHRHDEQEDHRRAVHREQLVVDLRRDQRVVRRAQLQADHQRLDAAEAEEHERRDHVHDPDPLVVGGRDPARPAARLALDAVGDDLGDGGCVGGHFVRWSPRCPRGSRPVRRRSGRSASRARPAPLRVGFGDQLLLVRQPRFELRRRHGLDGRDHARVAAPAEERALAAVDARALRS